VQSEALSHTLLQLPLEGVGAGVGCHGAGVGAGVGEGAGAEPDPTQSNLFGSDDVRPLIAPDLAVLSMEARTWSDFKLLLDSKSKAAAPETCGQAMDVPLMVADWESERCPAEVMLLPGA